MKKLTFKTGTIVFLVLVLFSYPLNAAQIEFGDVSVKNGVIVLNFSVSSFDARDMLEAVKRGIEVKIIYTIEIARISTFDMLYRDVLSRKNIFRSVKFDYWNRAFVITEGGKNIFCHSESDLLDMFFSVRGLPIAAISSIKEREFNLMVKAELKSIELYFPINYIFKYVLGLWDFETDWREYPSAKLIK